MIYFEGQQRDVSKVEKMIKFALRFSRDSLTEQCIHSVSEADESTNSDLEPKSKRVRSSDRAYVLSYADKETIMNGQELNDLHIHMAQKLLSSQYPNISGLQTTLYQYKQPLASSKNAIQIIHVQGNHWITISTINCEEGEVGVYDSLYNSIDKNTHELINHLVPGLHITLKECQKQEGIVDCGLFSIAISTSLAFSLANEICQPKFIFNQKEMRSHLIKCYEQNKLTPFP